MLFLFHVACVSVCQLWSDSINNFDQLLLKLRIAVSSPAMILFLIVVDGISCPGTLYWHLGALPNAVTRKSRGSHVWLLAHGATFDNAYA